MKSKRNWIVLAIILVAVALLVAYGRHRMHFDWRVFAEQLRQAQWGRILLALGCIYLGYVFRSVRWALLIRHNKKVPLLSLLGTQVIGFTAVALIGRVADPVRPYLVAKKTSLPLSSQVAVYIVERLFDAGSMALIFCSVILLAPAGALPHTEIIRRVGYTGLATTIAGGLFLLAVRLSGNAVASFSEKAFGLASRKLGQAVGDKIRTFHTGLDTLRSFSDFGIILGTSLAMWVLIALAYLETTHAFVASPQLGHMSIAQCMLLMASSMVASGFQLPILGWFTQIAAVAAALSGFFGVAPEPATGCAATLLLVTFLGIVPVGLIWSRFDHISLKNVTRASGHAEEEVTPPPATTQEA
ncbi:MAG TPA: lysylphosphatidylglycerol synthase transmembrane domain-containing protein [Acidobacteriaceae bacterium]|nr:lysylphosphatidylglycerol synthase transmembrane domain-containing protein [Acidobacteriaceae bacterium]